MNTTQLLVLALLGNGLAILITAVAWQLSRLRSETKTALSKDVNKPIKPTLY